jgi:hypothetical protein
MVSAKDFSERVAPIPNIINPRSGTIKNPRGVKNAGKRHAKIEHATARIGKILTVSVIISTGTPNLPL